MTCRSEKSVVKKFLHHENVPIGTDACRESYRTQHRISLGRDFCESDRRPFRVWFNLRAKARTDVHNLTGLYLFPRAALLLALFEIQNFSFRSSSEHYFFPGKLLSKKNAGIRREMLEYASDAGTHLFIGKYRKPRSMFGDIVATCGWKVPFCCQSGTTFRR